MALLVGVLGGIRPHPYHTEKNTKARHGHRALRGDMKSHHGASKMKVGAWRDVAGGTMWGDTGDEGPLHEEGTPVWGWDSDTNRWGHHRAGPHATRR